MTEIPRFPSDILGGRAKHCALDGHPPVYGVVMPRRQEAFDWQPKQHDPPVLPVEVPARNFRFGIEPCNSADLESYVLQFRPGAAQELDCRSDSQIKTVKASVERGKGRTNYLAPA